VITTIFGTSPNYLLYYPFFGPQLFDWFNLLNYLTRGSLPSYDFLKLFFFTRISIIGCRGTIVCWNFHRMGASDAGLDMKDE
jgi:hypothetical protein